MIQVSETTEIFAKRHEFQNQIFYQSIQGHVEDGLKILATYLRLKDKVIRAFCERWNIEAEIYNRNLFLAVALHDIGKITIEFQKNIRAGKSSSRYPHSLFAIPVLRHIPFDKFLDYPIPLLAILGHHTQLYRTIYEGSNLAEHVNFLEKELKQFINNQVIEFYDKLELREYFTLPDIRLEKIIPQGRTAIWDTFILPNVKKKIQEHEKLKSLFTYFFSILQLCDDYSSAYFNQYVENTQPNPIILHSVMINTEDVVFDLDYRDDEYKAMLFKNRSPHPFQKNLALKRNPNSFLFAPCGRGKTEASLWWAWNIKKEYNKERIVFALPTQVTCNAMYDRLIDTHGFGENEVGLFHGKSFIALKYRKDDKTLFEFDEEAKTTEELEVKSYNLLKDEVFKGNVFFKPITVTTIDHLAFSFVHGFSQADFACGNLQNAIIIFDEIHYYETHTLNVLMRLFNILRKMSIPHLLMTGTAPDFILQEIEKSYEMVIDQEGLIFQPFVISKQEEMKILENEEVFNSIKFDYEQGKKIFIILNQVEWAQRFYHDLKSFLREYDNSIAIILYHSQFIHKDRVKKESKIRQMAQKKPCILVATQVIEISLDISSDVMYTTVAPPDAIGQRAGRLNRKGKYYRNGIKFELKLFPVENTLPYQQDFISDTWNCVSNGPYSYFKIKEICDTVYKNVRLKKDLIYKDFFRNNVLFGNHHGEVSFGDDEGRCLRIREDQFQQIEVVPSRVFAEAEKTVRQKKAFWDEYKVRIPLFYLKKDIWEHGEPFHFQKHTQYQILECEFEYDEETGVQFDKTYKRVEFF
ncbi:MAG: CRISPR-associated helicase Cas3' [Calditrichia bacterium]